MKGQIYSEIEGIDRQTYPSNNWTNSRSLQPDVVFQKLRQRHTPKSIIIYERQLKLDANNFPLPFHLLPPIT